MANGIRLFLILAFAAIEARAATCEAKYQAEGAKATRWFELGQAGGDAKRACLAKAKNDLGNRGPSELGFPKPPPCERLPMKVSLWIRLDGKGRPGEPDAVVSSKLGLECPAKPKKPAKDD